MRTCSRLQARAHLERHALEWLISEASVRDELARRAFNDQSTPAANRALMEEIVDTALRGKRAAACARSKSSTSTTFKQVNDCYSLPSATRCHVRGERSGHSVRHAGALSGDDPAAVHPDDQEDPRRLNRNSNQEPSSSSKRALALGSVGQLPPPQGNDYETLRDGGQRDVPATREQGQREYFDDRWARRRPPHGDGASACGAIRERRFGPR